MGDDEPRTFGAIVRQERMRLGIGLRQFAKKIGVSPTYQSKFERDEMPPPAEEKVRKIAQIIGRDSDEMLALAGRVSSDLSDIIQKRPQEMASFLRTANDLTAEEMASWVERMKRNDGG